MPEQTNTFEYIIFNSVGLFKLAVIWNKQNSKKKKSVFKRHIIDVNVCTRVIQRQIQENLKHGNLTDPTVKFLMNLFNSGRFCPSHLY